jgi:protein-disulfide isomerase
MEPARPRRFVAIAAAATLLTLLPQLALPGGGSGGLAAQEGTRSALEDAGVLNRADSVRLRLAREPVLVLTEYVDFACSDCAAFHLQRGDSLRALVEEYDLVYAFRVYPIPRLLRGFQAAEAALCAGGVGGRDSHEDMRSLLFERQADWGGAYDPEPLFGGYGRDLGLGPEFLDCVRRSATWPLILLDVRQGMDAGIPGTPTFVVSRVDGTGDAEVFYGNQPMERFRQAVARLRGG